MNYNILYVQLFFYLMFFFFFFFSRPEKSSEPYLIDSFGHYYKHSLAIIDLDPKPFDKIPLYLKHDAAMISTCQKLQFPVS